jgi:hypothetical protein
VRVVPRWRTSAAAEPIRGQPVDLPQVLYPSERVRVWVRLDPPPAALRRGVRAMDVSLDLVEADEAIDVAEPGAPVVRVSFQ